MFADGFLRVAPGTPFPLQLPLAIYFLFSDGEGDFDGRLKIMSPQKQVLIDAAVGKQTKQQGVPMTFIVNILSMMLPEVGDYEIIVGLEATTMPAARQPSDPYHSHRRRITMEIEASAMAS